MAYLLDANVFIEAKNRYYGMSFCPAFWDWLDQAHAAGSVRSIEKVKDELVDRGDELSDWISPRASWFLAPDDPTVAALGLLIPWSLATDVKPAAKAAFADDADAFLVAAAIAGSHTVVTHERVDGSKSRIKIPVAAAAFGVDCINPFEMLRREQALFVMGARP